MRLVVEPVAEEDVEGAALLGEPGRIADQARLPALPQPGLARVVRPRAAQEGEIGLAAEAQEDLPRMREGIEVVVHGGEVVLQG